MSDPITHTSGPTIEKAAGHTFRVQRLAADLVSVTCLDPDAFSTEYPSRADIHAWFGVEALENFNGAGTHEVLYRVKP